MPKGTIALSALILVLPIQSAFAYTPDQLATGQAIYTQSCALCHGATMRQLPEALLAGREFITKWNERSPGELVAQIQATMPPTAPASLSEESAAALAAYLLEANGARAGNELLTAAATGRIADTLVGPPTGPPAPAPGAGGGGAPEPTGLTVAGTVPGFIPATDETLRDPDPADWLMLRHDYAATSYSELDEITAQNASRLTLAWLWPMQDGGTNQPAPIVYRGTLYLANTGGVVQALAADTGDLIWEYRVGNEVAPRGIVLYEDKLVFQTSGGWAVTAQAAHLVALDARTGALVWDVEMPDQYASNSGPIAINGLLIQGMGTCAT